VLGVFIKRFYSCNTKGFTFHWWTVRCPRLTFEFKVLFLFPCRIWAKCYLYPKIFAVIKRTPLGKKRTI